MSKAGSYQDLGRGHYGPPWVMIKQKYPGAARVNKDFLVNLQCEMFKFFFLCDHLSFASKARRNPQYLIKTDFPEGNHVLQS